MFKAGLRQACGGLVREYAQRPRTGTRARHTLASVQLGDELGHKVAVERLGAERIGHGIQIANPLVPRSSEVLREVVRRGIPLEVCPTSNVLTNAFASVAQHSVRRLLDAGVSVTINTDDPGVFDFNLSHEYDALADHLGFAAEDFSKCNEIAARASFIPLAERRAVWPGL